MEIAIRKFTDGDVIDAISIWNRVVEDGAAFPPTEPLSPETGLEFLQEQSFTGIAYDKVSQKIAGLYILHPNNIGRCGHICNASYAVSPEWRGKHVGELLVRHSMTQGLSLIHI